MRRPIATVVKGDWVYDSARRFLGRGETTIRGGTQMDLTTEDRDALTAVQYELAEFFDNLAEYVEDELSEDPTPGYQRSDYERVADELRDVAEAIREEDELEHFVAYGVRPLWSEGVNGETFLPPSEIVQKAISEYVLTYFLDAKGPVDEFEYRFRRMIVDLVPVAPALIELDE
jgi:hypothetical protein